MHSKSTCVCPYLRCGNIDSEGGLYSKSARVFSFLWFGNTGVFLDRRFCLLPEGSFSVMLLCPVVINRPAGGVICVGRISSANCTAM